MRRDARAYLWDALQAADLLREFGTGKDYSRYQADAMLRSAVERQFEIIGEALNQLSKLDASLAARIPDLSRIVAFRNISSFTATRRWMTHWSGRSSPSGCLSWRQSCVGCSTRPSRVRDDRTGATR